MNVLKSTSSSYVQNMTENMVFTSYLDRCFLLVMTPDSSLFLKYYYNCLQSEYIQKYQFELCSKYDREHGFYVILGWMFSPGNDS